MDNQTANTIPPFPGASPVTPPTTPVAPIHAAPATTIALSVNTPPPPVVPPVQPTPPAAPVMTTINNMPPSMPPTLNVAPEHKSNSKMLVVLLLVILLLAGISAYAYYTIYMLPGQEAAMMPAALPAVVPETVVSPTVATENADAINVDKMSAVSSSDEVASIEGDLKSTDLSTVKSGFTSVEQGL